MLNSSFLVEGGRNRRAGLNSTVWPKNANILHVSLSAVLFWLQQPVCVLEGTSYQDASAACQLLIKPLLSSLGWPLPRYGRDDADAKCSDAPDHHAEYDDEGFATNVTHTACWTQLSPASARTAGNDTGVWRASLLTQGNGWSPWEGAGPGQNMQKVWDV